MQIGILGSGDVAQTLAAGFIKHGHDVMLGTREPGKLAAFKERHPEAHTGSFADAARFAELAVLAVKGSVAAKVLSLAGIPNLARKPVIDATNPIAEFPPVKGVLRFFTALDESLMERLATLRARGALREGVQFGRQRRHGRPGVRGR
jgi:predicted dinucleotide-binding enzyme